MACIETLMVKKVMAGLMQQILKDLRCCNNSVSL